MKAWKAKPGRVVNRREERLRTLSWLAVYVCVFVLSVIAFAELAEPSGTPSIGVIVGVLVIIAAGQGIAALVRGVRKR